MVPELCWQVILRKHISFLWRNCNCRGLTPTPYSLCQGLRLSLGCLPHTSTDPRPGDRAEPCLMCTLYVIQLD